MEKDLTLHWLSVPGYEKVLYFKQPSVQLEGYIAIHSTQRGPALGGTRFWPYSSQDDALTDVLRLAQGMSYKAAGAELPLGGGKAVLIGNPNLLKSPGYFHAYAQVINQFKGSYITAEDMNINTEDIRLIAEKTTHVVGRSDKSGNPSPWTALGVFYGVLATLAFAFPHRDLSSLSFAIQGVGETGFHLLQQLVEHGAKNITISDINPEKVARIQSRYPFINVADDHTLLSLPVDVLCPCAFGGILNAHTLPTIQAKAIAGSANNIFLDLEKDPQRFHEAGILVAPDYIINAGGLINVFHEFNNDLDPKRLTVEVSKIGERLSRLYQAIKKTEINPFTYSLNQIIGTF